MNQILESGIFPDSIKIAKIIPLYKERNIHSITNYQPISLLPTIKLSVIKLVDYIVHEINIFQYIY